MVVVLEYFRQCYYHLHTTCIQAYHRHAIWNVQLIYYYTVYVLHYVLGGSEIRSLRLQVITSIGP